LGGNPSSPFWGIDSAGNLRDKATTFGINSPETRLNEKEKTMKTNRQIFSVLSAAFSFVLVTAGFALALGVGDKAPDFELDSTKGGKIKLSSLKGKNVLINFYVLDFSPT
jgi:AhpC/TSA family